MRTHVGLAIITLLLGAALFGISLIYQQRVAQPVSSNEDAYDRSMSFPQLEAVTERQIELVELVERERHLLLQATNGGQLKDSISKLIQTEESYRYAMKRTQRHEASARYNQEVGSLLTLLRTDYLEETSERSVDGYFSDLIFQLEGTRNKWTLTHHAVEQEVGAQ